MALLYAWRHNIDHFFGGLTNGGSPTNVTSKDVEKAFEND
jgi:hypothetical protein